jgi:hypothetical protein
MYVAFFPFRLAAFSTRSEAASNCLTETSQETESGKKNQRTGVSSSGALC